MESFRTIKIYSQTWMAENLSVEHYWNGDPIICARSKEDWLSLSISGLGCFSYHDFNPDYKTIYGCFYNTFAVIDNRGLAPEGFRLPTEIDWNILISNNGGYDIAGAHLLSLKEFKIGKDEILYTADSNSLFCAKLGGYMVVNDYLTNVFPTFGEYFGFWINNGRSCCCGNYKHIWINNNRDETDIVASGFNIRCLKI